MRMLFLSRGPNSGTPSALLDAWRAGSPELQIRACDLDAFALRGIRAKAGALYHAVRRAGPGVLLSREGAVAEAVKRSAWFSGRQADIVERAQAEADYDFSLAFGTVVPVVPRRPHFIYTDMTILANLNFPRGERHVELWREVLPYERETLRGARLVFTWSAYVARSLVEQYGLPPGRVLRVNVGCNVPHAGSPDPRRFERQRVLFVGVDWERKGGPELLAAFLRVAQVHPRARLTIAGCAPRIRHRAVTVLGHVSQARVSELLGESSVFCMPSRREAFGMALIEAMRAGLPVIASNLGAAPEFVIDGKTGYTVELGDSDTLVRRLESLLESPEECARMGRRGRALVESQYTWKSTQAKMWKAMEAALSVRGCVPR